MGMNSMSTQVAYSRVKVLAARTGVALQAEHSNRKWELYEVNEDGTRGRTLCGAPFSTPRLTTDQFDLFLSGMEETLSLLDRVAEKAGATSGSK